MLCFSFDVGFPYQHMYMYIVSLTIVGGGGEMLHRPTLGAPPPPFEVSLWSSGSEHQSEAKSEVGGF
jgi:hypothetical protein